MKTIVFCNLGTRDVEIPTEKPVGRVSARSYGAEIQARLKGGNLAENALAFPILKPAIDYILRRTNNEIHHLILVGTDQAEDVPERFRQNDTLYYVELAAAVFAARYGEKIKQVTTELIGSNPRINPNIYDDTLDVYEPLVRRHTPEGDTLCYLLASGGIPACNTALLLHGVWQFGERCQVVYQSEEGTPWALRVGVRMMDVIRQQSAAQFLDRFDFSSALQVLDDHVTDTIRELLQYAGARLWFDFSAAEERLDAARRDTAVRRELESIRLELQKLLFEPESEAAAKAKEKALIAEVYHNALVTWENRRYVDFLGRAVRFYEAVLHWLTVELFEDGRLPEAYQTDSLMNHPEMRRLLLSLLESMAQAESPTDTKGMAQLRQDLESYFNLDELKILAFDLSIQYENLEGTTLASKTRELVDYAIRHGQFNELFERIYQLRPQLTPPQMDRNGRLQVISPILQRLEKLVPLREKSIIAHGYTPVTPQILIGTYNQDRIGEQYSPTQDMFEACVVLSIQATNPFIQARDMIKELLQNPHE